MEDRLLFLISSPRSGSTMLARSIGRHSRILDGPELHLLTPLAHLGFWARVDTAPYDPLISEAAMREMIPRLPDGEADYITACRAYTDQIYGRLLDAGGDADLLLDKTPAYALVLPFIRRLYPRARYVVLTRNPMAIFSSFANSFFDGSYEDAQRHNPILDRYVPAIARFLREPPERTLQVGYEGFVADPESEMRRILEFAGVPFEAGTLRYGEGAGGGAVGDSPRGLGDPTGVGRHTRPVTDSVERWAPEIANDAAKRSVAEAVLEGLDDRDLETWGHPRAEIRKALENAREGDPGRPPRLSRYRLERRILVRVRRSIRGSPRLTAMIRRLRGYCDALLR